MSTAEQAARLREQIERANSAAMELAVAILVLVVTAILVSLPSPKPPGTVAPTAALAEG
jgi:hypothetical protein